MILAKISLYGLRGVEASHPWPPKSLLRRQLLDHISRNVAARQCVTESTCYVVRCGCPSSIPPTVPASSGAVVTGRVRVADVVAVVVSRRVRRVSSD